MVVRALPAICSGRDVAALLAGTKPGLTERELGDIVLKKPVITVIQSADERLNIATLGPTSEPRAPRPGRSPGAPAAEKSSFGSTRGGRTRQTRWLTSATALRPASIPTCSSRYSKITL